MKRRGFFSTLAGALAALCGLRAAIGRGHHELSKLKVFRRRIHDPGACLPYTLRSWHTTYECPVHGEVDAQAWSRDGTYTLFCAMCIRELAERFAAQAPAPVGGSIALFSAPAYTVRFPTPCDRS